MLPRFITRNILFRLGALLIITSSAFALTKTELVLQSLDYAVCGSTFDVQALLTYDAGGGTMLPLAGKEVKFDFGDIAASDVTDVNGIAHASFTVPDHVNHVQVDFLGDADYKKSGDGQGGFKVQPADPTAAYASATTVAPGGTVTLTVDGCNGDGQWDWYAGGCDVPGGGTSVGTGSPLVDVVVSATTTFYVCGHLTVPAHAWTTNCATVTVYVCTEPTVTAPSDESYQCKGDITPVDWTLWTVTGDPEPSVETKEVDNGGAGTTADPYIVYRTLTATNDCGSAYATQTITVIDDTPPEVTVPENISVDNDPDLCGAYVSFEVSANDNCDGALTPTAEPASGSLFPVGETTVSVSVTDAAGNLGTNSFTVTVKDVQLPTITPKDILACVDPAATEATVDLGEPATGDNCEVDMVTNDAPEGYLFPLGVTTVTWTVTDVNGNTNTATQTVSVYPRPTSVVTLTGEGYILDGESTTIQADLTGAASWTITWSDGVVETATSTPWTRTITGPVGTTTYTITALSDANGCNAEEGDMTGSATITIVASAKLDLYSALHTVTGTGTKAKIAKAALPMNPYKIFDKSIVGPTSNYATALASDNGKLRMVVLKGPEEVAWAGGKATHYQLLLPANTGLMIIGKVTVGSATKYTGGPADALTANTTTTKSIQYVVNSGTTAKGTDGSMDAMQPLAAALYQNYPDPFSRSTSIGFDVPANTPVTITVYNHLGRLVATLVENKVYDAGYHSVVMEADALPTGAYFCRLTAGASTVTRQMNLIK